MMLVLLPSVALELPVLLASGIDSFWSRTWIFQPRFKCVAHYKETWQCRNDYMHTCELQCTCNL